MAHPLHQSLHEFPLSYSAVGDRMVAFTENAFHPVPAPFHPRSQREAIRTVLNIIWLELAGLWMASAASSRASSAAF
jgi:uncharacterized membrane protein YccF (DUF307 family)